jgi:hypothetical protein
MKSQKIAIALALASPLLLPDRRAFADSACTYNDATTSFGSGYANNAQSSVASVACVAPTTAQRLLDTSLARTMISAPITGDFKFLVKNAGQTNAVPTFEMVSSLSPDTKVFPDSTIQAPSGGGCNDAGVTTGVNAIERHLHRNFKLWTTANYGDTYYYGDYNANPPNDPTTVTGTTSPYVKWAPYNRPQEYLYLDPNAWGPGSGVTTNALGAYPPIVAGRTAGTGCAAQGLTGTDLTNCNTCLSTKGYYLKDGAVAGDLMKSVFTGAILNDYPPAWVHLAWGFGYVLNFQLKDSSNNPLFQVVRDQYQSHNAATCPSAPFLDHAGGTYEPVGSADCSIAYPKYDWTRIQALGQGPIINDQSNMEGGNNPWASAATFSGTTTAPSTPAGDLLSVENALQTFATSTPPAGCKFCQPKAILYIGFGVPCAENQPSGLPSVTLNPPCTGECNYTNPAPVCKCGGGTNTNWLPQTANFLYNNDGIRTYFLGMGAHTTAMRRAAAEGHGKYFDAGDVVAFHDGLISILLDIISSATSSAASTVNAVQVNVAGQEEILPRFVAKTGVGNYEGHLLKYYLFNEFAANCTAANAPADIPNTQQKVCTAKCVCPGGSCTATWLVDSQCQLISPDQSGFLFQSAWNGTKLVPSTKGAVPVWDTNDQLRAVNWWQRKVYTALDTNTDGKIDSLDGDGTSPPGLYLVTASATAGALDLSGGISDTVADALIPYLGIQGTTMCTDIETALSTTLPGTSTTRMRACAKVILNFALGEDLLNENLLQPTDPNYRIIDRIAMLGDIFHSSPQDIGPPSSEKDCNYNTRRCVKTLFNGNGTAGLPDFQPLDKPTTVTDPATGNAVANPGSVDAYQAYYQHQTFGLKYPHVTLVGANDGMLHAVQTACFGGTSTVAGVVYPSYWDGPLSGSCASGTPNNGSELWAFIPPDLLGKLGYMLLGKHQYFVDSTPMVRDIYAPTGSPATATKRYTQGTPGAMDFKRIAIVGEREGGTHWFALDVTNPTAPSFRWIFPQPNTSDELLTGLSWGDWVPNAPPVVPVRIAAPTGVTGYPTYLDSSGTSQPFQEKWVVLLPGGYDPYGVAGKNIYMLDAYTGQKIFQAQPSGSTKLDFPFAALPAAIPWGSQLTEASPTYNKGFSDTALVGDLGGQVWTMRFNDVGQGTPVTNWFMGRSFRQYSADDSGAATGEYRMQHRNPIFQMMSAARMPEGPLRAFVGTGDRANMAENGVGQCSIYNPLACGKRQCVMTMATNATLGATAGPNGVSSYKGDAGATYISTTNAGGIDANNCTPSSTVLNACASCTPSPGTAAATVLSPGEPQYACVYSSTGWQCTLKQISDSNTGQRLEVTPRTVTPDPNTDFGYFNRFVAFNVFGTNRPLFTTAAQATTYDSNAFTETGLTNLFPSGSFNPVGPGPLVTGTLNGNSNGFYFNFPILDERTATNSLLLRSCVSWYTMQPGQACNADADCTGGTCNTTTHTCNAPQACGSGATAIPARTAYLYQVNAVTGGSDCGLTSSTALRTGAPLNAFVLPPPPAQQLISINAKGQVQYSIVAPAGQLSPPASTSSGGTATYNFSYTLETPRELHQCRHSAPVNDGSACF